VRSLTRILPLVVLLFALARADESLLHARRAQALLADDVWSEVIRLDNVALASVYPRTVHALIFEFVGRLWFYCSVNGTQSFSLYADRLAEDKADFAPLLREIEPGFRRWVVLADGDAPAGPLENGCFIESIATLRQRVAEGADVAEPHLLSYYIDTQTGSRGHTVLVYRERGRAILCDPSQPETSFSFPVGLARDAVKLARAFENPDVVKARLLPIPLPTKAPAAQMVAVR
jgi:hypothetical protein